jgi:hypothetical protein
MRDYYQVQKGSSVCNSDGYTLPIQSGGLDRTETEKHRPENEIQTSE